MERKKIKKQGELAYLYATVLLAIGTTLCIKADLGMSMISAPAYCLSHLFEGMMGYAEYVFQGALLVLMCLMIRMVRWQFLLSFLTALIYGGALNLLLSLTRSFQPESLVIRIALYAVGIALTTLAIAFYINSYLPLSVYELFVKALSVRYKWKFEVVKIVFDWSCLFVSLVLALVVFGVIEKEDLSSFGAVLRVAQKGGVYIGTLISTVLNGVLISFFGRLINRFMSFEPKFPRLSTFLGTKEGSWYGIRT